MLLLIYSLFCCSLPMELRWGSGTLVRWDVACCLIYQRNNVYMWYTTVQSAYSVQAYSLYCGTVVLWHCGTLQNNF